MVSFRKYSHFNNFLPTLFPISSSFHPHFSILPYIFLQISAPLSVFYFVSFLPMSFNIFKISVPFRMWENSASTGVVKENEYSNNKDRPFYTIKKICGRHVTAHQSHLYCCKENRAMHYIY